MSITVYQKGDLARIAAAFTTVAGAAVDPSTVRFLYTSPSGVTVEKVFGTDAEVVKASTGNYYIDLTPNEAGQWVYRWLSTGAGQAAEHGEFMVEPSDFVVEEA